MLNAVLVEIGKFSSNSNGTKPITTLNNILTNLGVAVGIIICVVALVKLVLSLADQNSVSKQQASLLLGVGLFFVALSSVVKALDLDHLGSKTAGAMAASILEIIGNLLTWAGGAVTMLAVIMLIMSIVNESAEQKADATRFIGVGIGLISINIPIAAIGAKVADKSVSLTFILNTIVYFVASLGSYIGGGFIILGIYHLILSIKNEDGKEKDSAIRLFIAGIALLGLRIVFQSMGLISNPVSGGGSGLAGSGSSNSSNGGHNAIQFN